MKKALTITSGLTAVFAIPIVASAQAVSNISDVGTLIINIINNVFVPVLFAIAFIVFIWGAFQAFILGANSTDVKEKGKNLMLYGLIGFFVMVSVWGLVNILTGSVDFGSNDPTLPTSPTSGVQVGG